VCAVVLLDVGADGASSVKFMVKQWVVYGVAPWVGSVLVHLPPLLSKSTLLGSAMVTMPVVESMAKAPLASLVRLKVTVPPLRSRSEERRVGRVRGLGL